MASAVPKPASSRQRRNRTSTAAAIEAPSAGKVMLPERSDDHPWHPLTVQTWDVWWASPIAAEWVDADVPGLIETAQLVDDFWNATTPDQRAKLRGEIRMSSREYGLSSFSRRQLQWEVRRLEGKAEPQAAPRSRRHRYAVLQGGA